MVYTSHVPVLLGPNPVVVYIWGPKPGHYNLEVNFIVPGIALPAGIAGNCVPNVGFSAECRPSSILFSLTNSAAKC